MGSTSEGVGKGRWMRDKTISCTSVMGCCSGQGGPSATGDALRNFAEGASTVAGDELEAGSVAP